jgi:hypothetical protein
VQQQVLAAFTRKEAHEAEDDVDTGPPKPLSWLRREVCQEVVKFEI